MDMNLITLATVKAQLGLSVTTYDASITAMIPIVSSDVRRILNNPYNKYIGAFFNSSDQILIHDTDVYNMLVNTSFGIELGQVVAHDNIPADTYIKSYNPDTGYYTLSSAATGSGTYIYPTIKLSMFPAISKMIWYKISKMNITDSIAKGIQSETYGPVSITYSDKEINKQYDYPQSLIDDLGTPYARVG